MTTSFPTSLDSFTNPTSGDNLDTSGVLHATQHANLNDAVAALEAKVGANSSAVTLTLDYKTRYPVTDAVAFASLPSAASGSGKIYLVTDIGSGGTLFRSNGTIWAPLGGRCVLAASAATGMALTGTTSKTTIASYTLPAGLMTANGVITITSFWNVTNNANNKTCGIDFGATGYLTQVLTTSPTFHGQTVIRNRNAANSQVGFVGGTYAISTGAPTTGAVDTASAVTIAFAGTLANASDTITLHAYSIELSIP